MQEPHELNVERALRDHFQSGFVDPGPQFTRRVEHRLKRRMALRRWTIGIAASVGVAAATLPALKLARWFVDAMPEQAGMVAAAMTANAGTLLVVAVFALATPLIGLMFEN